MKNYSLTIVAVIISIIFNGLNAQTTHPKLNQVELMRQFLGTWKSEIGKDTIVIGENSAFGNGMVSNGRITTKDKILDSVKQLYGYDKITDKFIIAELIESSPVIEMCAVWFTSEITGEMVLFQDISNPDKASLKWKFEFKSPGMIVQTAFLNSKMIKQITLNRINGEQ
jgi:hypothetical protein